MTPHRDWFYEYKRYEGEMCSWEMTRQPNCWTRKSLIDTIGWGTRALLSVLHIPGSERNLIFVRKMSDAGVHTLF
jgi:hypothetical protein